MSSAERETRQRTSDSQIAFIIQTRDNYKPAPNGTKSTTDGPLTWPKVARAYEKKFGVATSVRAMEGRVRRGRNAWLAKNPEHPVKIEYSHKVKGFRSPVREYPRIAGWQAPNLVRDAACPDGAEGSVEPEENDPYTTIEVVDADYGHVCAIRVEVANLRRTSDVYRRELRNYTRMEIQLQCSTEVAVKAYLRCIALPYPATPDDLACMDLDLTTLFELYGVAAQLEDAYVRDMVLTHWQTLAETDVEMEFDERDLSGLFHSTQPDDPARAFWVDLVYAVGLAEHIVLVEDCHSTLVAMLDGLIAEESM